MARDSVPGECDLRGIGRWWVLGAKVEWHAEYGWDNTTAQSSMILRDLKQSSILFSAFLLGPPPPIIDFQCPLFIFFHAVLFFFIIILNVITALPFFFLVGMDGNYVNSKVRSMQGLHYTRSIWDPVNCSIGRHAHIIRDKYVPELLRGIDQNAQACNYSSRLPCLLC